jgi:hypothetical protein
MGRSRPPATLWTALTTSTPRDRKELLRTLISEVFAHDHEAPRRAEIEILWEGCTRVLQGRPALIAQPDEQQQIGRSQLTCRPTVGGRCAPSPWRSSRPTAA